MQLSWLQYQNGNKSKYYLVLILLELEDRYVALMTKDIDGAEIQRIRGNLKELDNCDTTEKIQWFKQNISSYNKAYKEFKKKQAKIDNVFDLKALNG